MAQENSSNDDVQAKTSTVPSSVTKTPGGLQIRCPHCHHPFQIVLDAPLTDIECSCCFNRFNLVDETAGTHVASPISQIEHFELIERVGLGSFGTVWKARDTRLERTVAVKIPRKGGLSADELEKFLREARSAAQLDHPQIIHVHEVGRHGDSAYLVTDYVRGVSLAEWLTIRRITGHESAELLRQIAEAVHHAHEAGVIHRDLKPHNIIMDKDGQPHVMDFGLARREALDVTMTLDGQVLGTPAYMSPEQASGEGHKADRRSDVYSLGVILFQMLTGELPFRGSTNVLIHQVIHDDAPSPRRLNSGIHRDLETICLKSLEKDPDRRYATARQLADDLRRFISGEPVHARPIGRVDRAWRWCRRNPLTSSLLAAAFMFLLTGAAVSSYFALRAGREAKRADAHAAEVTATLYDALLSNMQATRTARVEGYRETVWDLAETARQLETPARDLDALRREVVLSLGDFVGYAPTRFKEFEAKVTALSLDPAAKEAAIALSSGVIWLCSRETGEKRDQLSGSDSSISALAHTPDGAGLVAVDEEGIVRIWNHTEAGLWKLKDTFSVGEGPLRCSISPHARFLTAADETTVRVWDLSDGRPIHELSSGGLRLANVALSPGLMLVAGSYTDPASEEGGLVVWEAATGAVKRQIPLKLGSAYARSIAFSADGRQLAVGFDQALLVYDAADFTQLTFKRLDATKAVTFSPNGQFLAAVDIRGVVTIWSTSTDREIASLSNLRKTVSQEDLLFSADGSHLVASNSHSVRAWRLNNSEERLELGGHAGGVPSIAYHPRGDLLASAGKDRLVRLWNPQDGTELASLELPAPVQPIAFCPDGRYLAVGYVGAAGEGLRIFDVATQRNLLQFSTELKDALTKLEKVFSLAFFDLNQQRHLALCGQKGVAIARIDRAETESDRLLLTFVDEWPANRCLHLTASQDSKWLAWVRDSVEVRLWDISRSREQPTLAPRMAQGWHGLAFHPDGKHLLYVSGEGVAEVWNVEHDRRAFQLGAPGQFNAPHISLSGDGKWLAGLLRSSSVGVWNLETGEHLLSFRPERNAVWSLAWSPQRNQLAVGLSDGGLNIWNIPKIRMELARLGLDWTDSKE